MAKRRTIKPPPDDLYYIKYDLESLNSRTSELITKVGDLTRYTEYLARNVDLLIDYTEHIAELYSANMRSQKFEDNNFLYLRRAPSFDDFKEEKGS